MARSVTEPVKGLRPVLLKLDRIAGAQEVAKKALRVLRGFASAFHVNIFGVDVGITPEEGVADTGDLVDLPN